MTHEPSSLYLLWTTFFLVAYAGFCIYWGSRQSVSSGSAFQFFVAGRSLPYWVFILSATTASFAGWIFIAQPGLVSRDGFPAAYLSFCAIVVPLGGIFFLKRQWMLGKRFGFITPGEMYSAYYQSQIPRLFTVLIAILFAIPLFGAVMGAAGHLLSSVTEGWLSREAGMWLSATLTLIYVSAGGMRAFAFASTLQGILIAAGVIILGFAAISLAGGFQAVTTALSEVATNPDAIGAPTNGYGGGNFSSWFAIPGVVQFTAGLEHQAPVGSVWTSAMILSFLCGFLGLQISPAFSMLAFSMTDTKPLASQQVWYSSFGVGILLFLFATFQGVAASLLGANASISNAGLALGAQFPDMSDGWHGQVVPALVELVAAASPWLGAIVTLCAVAALTAASGAYLLSSSAVISRDVYVSYFRPTANGRSQIVFGRVIMLILTVLGLLMASFAKGGMIALGAIALSLSLQLLPALAGVSWISWLSRQAVNSGLIVGTVVVILTSEFGQYLAGESLPWGQSPWTIHPALWGIFANVVTCLIISLVTKNSGDDGTREFFHAFLREHDKKSKHFRGLVSAAWVLTIAWVFFAFGPGAVFGNWAFGSPDAGFQMWDFQIPSIWAWQLIWWGAGVILIWFLANRLGLSTAPEKHIYPMADDILSLSNR